MTKTEQKIRETLESGNLVSASEFDNKLNHRFGMKLVSEGAAEVLHDKNGFSYFFLIEHVESAIKKGFFRK